MSLAKATLHNIVDCDAQVLRGRHLLRELRQKIQILVVVAFQDLAVHEAIQINQIANHTGLVIDRPTDGDLDGEHAAALLLRGLRVRAMAGGLLDHFAERE